MNTREEQEYFYDMFNEMWGEKMPEQDQYCLSKELAKIERVRINDALDIFEGNQTKAAQSLNIGRTALIAKMKKYKLN
jgi:DNA-binding NtrC family response regulator